MSSTCVIMAAGTGGHVFPGLAVRARCSARLERQLARHPHGMENKLVPPHRHPDGHDRVRRPARQGPARTRSGGMRLLRAFWQLPAHPAPARADAVLGMGGYVCFPGG